MESSSEKTRQDRFINPWRRYVGSFVPNWLLCRHEVSPMAKLLYARLAQYAGQKGVAYPRQDTLARELGGLSERTVRRYVAELREHRLIHVEDRRNKNYPNKYKFLDHPWQHEGDVIDDDDESNSNPPEGSEEDHRTESSSGSGGPQDKADLSGQDKVVLSRRESLERESPPPEETHSAGRSRARSEKRPPKPPPKPKTFEIEDTPPPLGSEQDEGASGEEEEKVPKPAARPKTRRRLTKAQQIAAEAAKRATAQVSANAQKRMKAQEAKERAAKNRASKGPQTGGVRELEKVWNAMMAEHMPDLTIAWDAKQRGQAKHLIDRYGVQIASDALRYVVENWSEIGPRYFKRPGVPTIGLVLRLHDSLVIEAQKWSQHRQTISEWEEWAEKNPYSLDPPGDLKQRYRKAKAELESLGIGGT